MHTLKLQQNTFTETEKLKAYHLALGSLARRALTNRQFITLHSDRKFDKYPERVRDAKNELVEIEEAISVFETLIKEECEAI